MFHLETFTNISTLNQVNTLLEAIKSFDKYQFVFLGTNADTNSNIIREMVKAFVASNDNTIYFENLHTDAYHCLLKKSICLIENSSSGIIEVRALESIQSILEIDRRVEFAEIVLWILGVKLRILRKRLKR